MNLIIQFTFYTNQENTILYPNPVYDPDIIKSPFKIPLGQTEYVTGTYNISG